MLVKEEQLQQGKEQKLSPIRGVSFQTAQSRDLKTGLSATDGIF